MKKKDIEIYTSPSTGKSLKIGLEEIVAGDEIIKGFLISEDGEKFNITNGIVDFTWPKELAEVDEKTRKTYEKLAAEYDKFAAFPFLTFMADEDAIREDMVNRLNINENSKVLEIGAGDGRGAKHVAKRLGSNGRFFVQELSESFLNKSLDRLSSFNNIISFSIANASYIPCVDNYFDAAYHFGGISTFSDVNRCLSELARVVKPGGKVLVGDESMGPWLRETEFGKVMSNSNPLFKYEIPFKDIPLVARDVKVEWIMQGAFFILEFTIGETEPKANYHIPIPSERGGTHWSRYYGNLEGVSEETKLLALEARKKSGLSMHEWLNEIITLAANKQLNKNN